MNYEIHIEDMHNLVEPLILMYAEKGTITQNWLGGDDKTQPIVGCELNFTLEVFGADDFRYGEFFTTDEKRYRVTKYIEGTTTIIYRGYLLPESYSEPYNQQIFYIDLSAVDGLGLLKGQKMPDDFYKKEHFVTDVIAQILDYTKVGFEIYIAPAIRNHLNKKWHEIVIDGRKYFDEDKPPSAHDILEEIIHDMRCQLFQSEGRWYIEGINFRHLRSVKFDKYSPAGEYLGSFNVEKNVKAVHWSPTPNIAMVPGLREVIVTHKAAKLEISSEVYKDTNIDWINAAGVLGKFLPRHWNYGPFQPHHRAPDYFLELHVTNTSALDKARFITLKEKPYLLKGYKVRMKLEFELVNSTVSPITRQQIEDRRSSGVWIDMQVFQIKLNDTVLFTNENTVEGDPTRLVFKDDLKASVDLEFIAGENGYLDVKLFQPVGVISETLINRVRLTNLKAENIEQKEDFVYTEIVNEDSTQVKEIDLDFSDDISLQSKAFYLEKVRELPEHAGTAVMVPIRYGRQQNGKNYSIVSVEGAAIIEQFPNKVGFETYFDRVTPPPIVHYNLNGGEEMAIETEQYYPSGEFYVLVQAYKPATIERTEWLKWSDAVYEVEQKPYAQVVAEIESKIFKLPHFRIEATAQAPIKFNDIILQRYNNKDKYFVPTSVNWNAPENEAGLTLIEGIYSGNSLGEIPPYVDAGPDIFLAPGETSAQITEAVVNAPHGFIESLLWEKVTGDAGESYSSPSALNPLISGLTGDAYEFRLTATDNFGNSASDTMRVLRRGEYQIMYELVNNSSSSTTSGSSIKETYRVYLSPDLPANTSVNLNFTLRIILNLLSSTDNGNGFLKITKNGFELFSRFYEGNGNSTPEIEQSSLISFNQQDEILILLEAEVNIGNLENTASAKTQIDWTGASFVNGLGTVTNLPATKSVEAYI